MSINRLKNNRIAEYHIMLITWMNFICNEYDMDEFQNNYALRKVRKKEHIQFSSCIENF